MNCVQKVKLPLLSSTCNDKRWLKETHTCWRPGLLYKVLSWFKRKWDLLLHGDFGLHPTSCVQVSFCEKEKNFDTIEKWPIGNLKWSLKCLPKSFRNKTALIYSETQLKVILVSCMIHFKVYFLSDFLQKFKVWNLPHSCHLASQLNSQ